MGPRDLSPWGQDELKHLVQESKKKQNSCLLLGQLSVWFVCAHVRAYERTCLCVRACGKGRSKLLIFMSFPAEVTVLVIIASSNTCIRHCTEHAQCFQK